MCQSRKADPPQAGIPVSIQQHTIMCTLNSSGEDWHIYSRAVTLTMKPIAKAWHFSVSKNSPLEPLHHSWNCNDACALRRIPHNYLNYANYESHYRTCMTLYKLPREQACALSKPLKPSTLTTTGGSHLRWSHQPTSDQLPMTVAIRNRTGNFSYHNSTALPVIGMGMVKSPLAGLPLLTTRGSILHPKRPLGVAAGGIAEKGNTQFHGSTTNTQTHKHTHVYHQELARDVLCTLGATLCTCLLYICYHRMALV